MTLDPKAVETAITGMTKGEIAVVISAVLIAYSTLIAILGYIMRLHLKPLQGVPNQLNTLNAKVKSGEDLNLMIKAQVSEHALTCPARSGCNNNKNKEIQE